jgi:hypothetical protein
MYNIGDRVVLKNGKIVIIAKTRTIIGKNPEDITTRNIHEYLSKAGDYFELEDIDYERTAKLSTETQDGKPDDVVYLTEEDINRPEEKIAKVISDNLQNGKVEIFKTITDEMLQLYKDKNEDYGDSFKKVREEYPHAIIIRLMDKLERLKSLHKGNVNIKDEGIDNVLIDMANYCVMEMVEREVENATKDVRPKC